MHRILTALMLGALALPGCEPGSTTTRSGDPGRASGTRSSERMDKLLDGSFGDWGVDELGDADGRWVWLRFTPETRPSQAIQAANCITQIRIDADMDPKTGREMEVPVGEQAIMAQPQGVDLLIEFSPKNKDGGIGIGTAVTEYDAGGKATKLGHADIGMACLPT